MGGMIARQPNGLLCRVSSVIDAPTNYNMTEEDYIRLCIERGVEEAQREAKNVLKNHICQFERALCRIRYGEGTNMSEEEFDSFRKAVNKRSDEVSSWQAPYNNERVFRAPCTVGDSVYYIFNDELYSGVVDGINLIVDSDHPEGDCMVIIKCNAFPDYCHMVTGAEVFHEKEEAEKALDEMLRKPRFIHI